MKKPGPLSYIVALFGVSMALGVLMATFGNTLGGAPLPVIAAGAGVAFLVGVGILLSIQYWKRIDEAAREAHKSAWFWGGQAGIIFALLGYSILVVRPEAEAPLAPGFMETPAHYVATGGMITLMLMIAGYGVAWAVWWFVKGR